MVSVVIVTAWVYPYVRTKNYISQWYSKNIHGVKTTDMSIGRIVKSPIGIRGDYMIGMEYDTVVMLGNGATYSDKYLFWIRGAHNMGRFEVFGHISSK